MDEESVMDHATSAGAGALIINGLAHLQELSIQSIGVLVGIAWVLMQMYYKVKNERKKSRN